jgi:regulatory helix-turn-helix LysR family protein
LHVVDQGSITQGAERAHLSLASASARITAMEKALGAKLLERHRRGVVPSPTRCHLERFCRSVSQTHPYDRRGEPEWGRSRPHECWSVNDHPPTSPSHLLQKSCG